MTKDEVREIVEALVRKYEGDSNPPIEPWDEDEQFDPPTRQDWEVLERKFNCSFPPEFVSFVEVITDYNLPGMLNVTREGRVYGGKTYGEPTLDWSYDHEMSFGTWNPDLIPFIDESTGDYFCLSASEGPQSGVYYVYHEDNSVERLTDSFPEWLERLEEFLNG